LQAVCRLRAIHDGRYFFAWRPLATSPSSVGAFFSGRALCIPKNEALWGWLPLGAALFLARRLTRRCNRPPGGEVDQRR
jgi:hypothetical protein